MVRELAHHKLVSGDQAMLKTRSILSVILRAVQTSVWFDEAQAGNYDLTLARSSRGAGPIRLFQFLVCKRAENYSKWHNRRLSRFLQQINREVDEPKRKPFCARPRRSWEQDPPLLPVATKR